MMESMIVLGILLMIAGGAILYLRREKKRGGHCAGCPCGKHCGERTVSCKMERKSK